MADITLIEINQLDSASVSNPDMYFAVDYPIGGGGYAQRKIKFSNVQSSTSDQVVAERVITASGNQKAPNVARSMVHLEFQNTVSNFSVSFPVTPLPGWTLEIAKRGVATQFVALISAFDIEEDPATEAKYQKWVFSTLGGGHWLKLF